MPNPELSPGPSAMAGSEKNVSGDYQPGQAIRRIVRQEAVPTSERRDLLNDTRDLFDESLTTLAETAKGNEQLISALNGFVRELNHCAMFGTGAERQTLAPEYAQRLQNALSHGAAWLRSTRA